MLNLAWLGLFFENDLDEEMFCITADEFVAWHLPVRLDECFPLLVIYKIIAIQVTWQKVSECQNDEHMKYFKLLLMTACSTSVCLLS